VTQGQNRGEGDNFAVPQKRKDDKKKKMCEVGRLSMRGNENPALRPPLASKKALKWRRKGLG